MDRFLAIDKLEHRMWELDSYRFMDMKELEPMEAMADTTDKDAVHTKVPEKIEGVTLKNGDFFNADDEYLWIHKNITMPSKKEGCEIAGIFDFSRNGGFEAQLYIDRSPYQGIDSNHKEIIFQGMDGKEVELTFLLWSGIDGGGSHRVQEHKIHYAKIGYLHKTTDDFYYYTKSIVKILRLLEDGRTEKHDLEEALNSAMLLMDWDRDNFYDTIENAYKKLMNDLEKIQKQTNITINCVGHTHIDVAWLWRLKHTREKAMRSFSTVLHLMDEFDEYIFLQSQPQLYAYIKNDSPELYAKIKERIAEGKWEIDGGMWLEADCNITSGESLSRQFLYGIRFMKEEFGQNSSYLWLPDVFGYSWALPQIMKQCNIKSFVTTKISWNQFNTMPDDMFCWRGIDGSEVLTYFVTTPDDGSSFQNRINTYNGMMSPHTVTGTWEKFKNKDLSHEVLLAYGFGDGGGGVTRDMLRMRETMDKLPGLPNVKAGKAGEFLDRMHQNVNTTNRYVHTWDGELYLEYHRGTYTTQANNKKWNRRMENNLAQTEWLSSLAMLQGGNYEGEALRNAWSVILRNQFHDIIPGSSIHEVYEDSKKEYEAVYKEVTAIADQALTKLVQTEGSHYTLYSFNSFNRCDIVFLPVKEEGCFEDLQGNCLKSQRTELGYYIQVPLEPFSLKEIVFIGGSQKITSESLIQADIGNKTVETPFYKIQWDEKGALCQIYDKKQQRNVLTENGRGNILELFEDKPLNFDAWDIDIYYQEKKEEAVLSSTPELVEEGALQTKIRFKYVYKNSVIEQDMVLYTDKMRIDFETKVDWHEEHKLLKTAFETSIRSTKASYDIQYGYVERPTHYNTSWDMARFEVVGHKWADLSEVKYGLSILNNCKYGYSIKDNVMKLSLLKSSKSPDGEADMGVHNFTYSIYPHTGTISDGGTIEEAAALNLPIQYTEGRLLKQNDKLIKIDSDSVWIDAIKKSEDENCIILRAHECRGGSALVQISSDYPVISWEACNILEEGTGEITQGNMITTTFSPFEIKNYKIKL